MNGDKVFVDTNLFVYLYSEDDDKEIMPIDGGDAAKLVRKTVKENGEVLETTILKDEIIKL
jgi:predicted nucleic acid-binding protein